MNHPVPAHSIVTERDWQRTITEMAQAFGWRVYHPWTSIHSEAGFPDLVMVKPEVVLFAELKSDRGKLTPSQVSWLAELQRCYSVVLGGVWRPCNAAAVEGLLRWGAHELHPILDESWEPMPNRPAKEP